MCVTFEADRFEGGARVTLNQRSSQYCLISDDSLLNDTIDRPDKISEGCTVTTVAKKDTGRKLGSD